MTVTACRLFQGPDGTVTARVTDMPHTDLSPGSVLIRVHWSGINYKDALAVTGRGRIARTFPLNAGCDGAGTVVLSSDTRVAPGDQVIVGGMSLSENHDGAFATYLRVPADWVIPLPDGLTLRESMIVGTAGFSAALALHRMEMLGQHPGLGPVVVTGAAGGVGSFAVSMLARRGYHVIAVTGRPRHSSYLLGLGAREVATPESLSLGTRPLESGRFGGAIDNVGGSMLAGLLRHIRPWGNVASVGNAGGADFAASVFPFILRGVSLLGGSSSNCPMNQRQELWKRLGGDLKPGSLDSFIDRVVTLQAVVEAAGDVLNRQVRGRVLVELGN